MSILSKLDLKSVTRANTQDPIQQRRGKLADGIAEQMSVAAATADGNTYEVTRKTWVKNEQGEKLLVERTRAVRPWFFEQDGGWYVQCKYGNKALALGKGNAVFVKSLQDVTSALEALTAAVAAGELDDAIEAAATRKASKNR